MDVGREWISSEHHAFGKQASNDPLENNATRNTARPWWVALETMKELEDCLKKLDHGVSRKRRTWATQQKAEVNRLKLGSQLKRTCQSVLREYFEEAMRTTSSALPLMANPFVRTAGQLMFAWSLVGIELEVLTPRDKLKLGNKSLEVYQMLVQHVARDNSGLSLARRKDATCFLRWIMSVMTNSTVQACHQKAKGSKTMERRVSTVILNVYQSTGIGKEDESRQSLENHGKLDEIRRFHNKKFEEEHDVHRNLALAADYSRPNKKVEYQYVSGVMGIAYNPFRGRESSQESRGDGAVEVLDGKGNRNRFNGEGETEQNVISVPRSSKRVELRMENGNGMMTTNLGTVWNLLRPSWCPHPHASLIEEVTERVRLTPTKDEDLGTLNVIHKLILPQSKESGEATSKLGSIKKLEPVSCLDLTCGSGGHTCDERSCVTIQSFQREDLVTWFGDKQKERKARCR